MSHVPGPVNLVRVSTSTWERDAHELFDFEASAPQRQDQEFVTSTSVVFLRHQGEIRMISDLSEAPPAQDAVVPLVRLVQRMGAFWVDKASPLGMTKKLWVVVRDMARGRHQITEGDVIRLGRFKFHVAQLAVKTADGLPPQLKLGNLTPDDTPTSCGPADFGETQPCPMCRICLVEGHTQGDQLAEDGGAEKQLSEEDPLIAPCKCKGSMQYVHRGCLRHWIRERLCLPETSSDSFFYRPLTCELCHAHYPSYFVGRGGERSALMDFPMTQAPFIVLQKKVRDSQQHTGRGLHVISLANKPLTLGRGENSDVRIADVSISRSHARIRFHEGQFLLEDNNSKFGTLVAMKRPESLRIGLPVSLQMGSTVLKLSADFDADLVQPHPLVP